MSKFFKNLTKTKNQEKLVVPRTMQEIEQEYSRLASEAGQNQYQSYVLEQDLARINYELMQVNKEAAARKALDKQESDKLNAKTVGENNV